MAPWLFYTISTGGVFITLVFIVDAIERYQERRFRKRLLGVLEGKVNKEVLASLQLRSTPIDDAGHLWYPLGCVLVPVVLLKMGKAPPSMLWYTFSGDRIWKSSLSLLIILALIRCFVPQKWVISHIPVLGSGNAIGLLDGFVTEPFWHGFLLGQIHPGIGLWSVLLIGLAHATVHTMFDGALSVGKFTLVVLMDSIGSLVTLATGTVWAAVIGHFLMHLYTYRPAVRWLAYHAPWVSWMLFPPGYLQ